MSHNSYGLQVKFLHYPHMLYIASPNSTTLSCKLNWRHYVEILKGDAPLETGFYVILIKSCLCILFPKCAINAAFREQNSTPYFLGQLIYVALCQCIIPHTFRDNKCILFNSCSMDNTNTTYKTIVFSYLHN